MGVSHKILLALLYKHQTPPGYGCVINNSHGLDVTDFSTSHNMTFTY